MSLVAIVARDLIIATRIADAATAAGHEVARVDSPSDLPPRPTVDVAFVDWGERSNGWAETLTTWLGAGAESKGRLILFGPHTDRAASAQAVGAGIGPMRARSWLLANLHRLMRSVVTDER